ncbi:hypothetical protein ONE63_011221 [Megalurothrips usitatus]|uniref:Odorant receptor n=1 Tax=Megalurothrips usitatus TaxID=439358 RepID=A0AAV7X680_9NEOP|nr:hypothetical protein ONE63_011221 [Megalurothrips usitatus]
MPPASDSSSARCARELSALLRDWQQELLVTGASSKVRRLVASLRGTRLTVAVCAVTAALSLVDAPRGDGSLHDNPVRVLSALVSCVPAQMFFLRRVPVVQRVLQDLMDAASILEPAFYWERQDELLRTARRGRLVGRVCASYAVASALVILSVLLPDDGESRVVLGLRGAPLGVGVVGVVAVKAAVTLSCVSCLAAFYTCLTVLLVMYTASASLLGALGDRFGADSGPEQLALLCRAHGRLVLAVCRADAVFRDLYPLYLSTILLLPLLTTTEVVVTGNIDLIALSTMPVILCVFVPLCFAGQRLQDTSVMVCWLVYGGRWVSEGVLARRLRVHAMAMANKGCGVSVHGLGPLDRPACARALSNWFRFLQMLLSLRAAA